MVFSSNAFLIFFFPVAAVLYYALIAIPHKSMTVANIWLLVVSLFFYAWGEPRFVFIMLASIVVNYLLGKLLLIIKKQVIRKLILAIGCIVNLGLLFVFKYLPWVSGYRINLTLPIGISFYTFQAMSYVIDVYRGGYTSKQTKFINVGLYIAFFPQLIAGPIVRFSTVANQINGRKHNLEKISEGFWRFAKGLVKKVLIANQVAPLVDLAFDRVSGPSVILAWLGAVASMLQIYFDFSGYSDMAIGLGKIFGFDFEENFNYPFASKSITEYWQRWHISLGQWFRDYLYFPLSLGSGMALRTKLTKKYNAKTGAFVSSLFVLFIVWMSTGIWHGANWTFVIWGLSQFVIILLEQGKKPVKIWCHVKTILLCIICGVMFKASSVGNAGKYYLSMFGLAGNKFADGLSTYWIGQYAGAMIIGIIFSFPLIPYLDKKISSNTKALKCWNVFKLVMMVYLFITAISTVFSSDYNPFIYFNF